MSTQPQVGKVFANFPPFSAEVGKLAKVCQLQFQSNQTLTEMLANWQIGKPAKLPTYLSPCAHDISSPLQVGGDSPSYYVGEGTEVPSVLRGGLARDGETGGHRCGGTALLTLDLGTHTGWALRHRDGTTASGTEHFQPHRFEGGGMRYLRFKRWLAEVARAAEGPDAVFFEEVRNHAGVDAAHAYGGFLAHLTAWCEQHQIPYQGVPVGTIKKHATGRGNANKAAMVAAMRARGHAVADDNQADALALLHWALAQGV